MAAPSSPQGPPASWREKPFRCPHCRKKTKPRVEGHINPHWVADAYTCKGTTRA